MLRGLRKADLHNWYSAFKTSIHKCLVNNLPELVFWTFFLPSLSLSLFSLICLVFETGSCYVAQAGLKLLSSRNPPASASQVAGTTGVLCPILPFEISYVGWYMPFMTMAFCEPE
jgi:hypothetical protein